MTTLTAPPHDGISPPTSTSSRLRAGIVAVLIAVIGVGTTSAVVSRNAAAALYEPDLLMEAFGDLPQDPLRAEAVGAWLAQEAVAGLAVEQRLTEALPLGLSIVAEPLTDRIEDGVAQASSGLIQTELFAEIWAEALPLMHAQFVGLARGSEDAVLDLEDGAVTMDLDRAILAAYASMAEALPEISGDGLIAELTGLEPGQLKAALGRLLETSLPEDLGDFVLLESEALASVQSWESRLGWITGLSIAGALTAAVAALVLARRRAVVVLAAAVAITFGAVIGLLLVTGAETAFVDAMRDLPWTGAGPDVDALLNGWLVAAALLIITAIGAGATGLVLRFRRPVPTPAASEAATG